MYMYVCMYVCIYTYIYTYIYAYMYAHIYNHRISQILITDVLKRPLRRLSTINGFRKVVTSQYLSFGGRLRAPLILTRQHTSAYAHTYVYTHTYRHTHTQTHTKTKLRALWYRYRWAQCLFLYAYVSIRQHTIQMSTVSFLVRIRQHTSAHVCIRLHTAAYGSIRQHTAAYGSSSRQKKDCESCCEVDRRCGGISWLGLEARRC